MYREARGVTAFLESDGKILVLLRSNRVSTYPGKWAGISGSIEKGRTADDQALIEIEEETGLSREDIQLVKKGEPLVFDDNDIQVRKVVYPYLFHVRDRDRVTLDWEHTRMQWIDPADIGTYDTMPKLEETLARVLAGPDGEGEKREEQDAKPP
jgi:8-oxo-dGTP diphosphatase